MSGQSGKTRNSERRETLQPVDMSVMRKPQLGKLSDKVMLFHHQAVFRSSPTRVSLTSTVFSSLFSIAIFSSCFFSSDFLLLAYNLRHCLKCEFFMEVIFCGLVAVLVETDVIVGGTLVLGREMGI